MLTEENPGEHGSLVGVSALFGRKIVLKPLPRNVPVKYLRAWRGGSGGAAAANPAAARQARYLAEAEAGNYGTGRLKMRVTHDFPRRF